MTPRPTDMVLEHSNAARLLDGARSPDHDRRSIEVPPKVSTFFSVASAHLAAFCQDHPCIGHNPASPSSPTSTTPGTLPSAPTVNPSTPSPDTPSTHTPSRSSSLPSTTSTISSSTPAPIDPSSTNSADGDSSSSLSPLPSISTLTASAPPPSNPTTSNSAAVKSKSTNRTPIVAGVVGAIVLLALLAAVVALYQRRRRLRDRREWERTHAEIADAVREVGGPGVLPATAGSWSRVDHASDRGFPREKSTDPLFWKDGAPPRDGPLHPSASSESL
ncbi:hypothetical protein B0H17DRAFT_1199184 [Mycena rosella]|uniref:Epidermal growth factor receptor-like transmembrane-juxtamembrane segment domain-containing protein n=1 Tax=Mycena rosella TaxID=1033263 RepID=A0AAD7DPS7_MYCRO|nr:hypothetical protein B0H17DRAFT_1199184 [Mycena rosella]